MPKITLISAIILYFLISPATAQVHKITAYCACNICCGSYSDGFVASGKRARVGFIACNYLPFGTIITIAGLGDFNVQDRGSVRYFGTRATPTYAIDVYFDTHNAAKQFGVRWLDVIITNQPKGTKCL